MKREIVTLYGRVQAVGFRERVIEIAHGRDIAGTVRNLRAGNALELDVEGDDSEVDAFVDAVIAGRPSFARIDGVNRRRAEPRGIAGFERAATG